ncbi:MAG: hypothetical protein BGP06_20320 [Rhizobiales bacterium 65-9]|nr:DUF1330 domain-containing protein [Hyphomicrobiales bacterium]OJY39777.1 MAG: hypothetical protein BGP06_20320 [Rhizobiales bacterium 65-9]
MAGYLIFDIEITDQTAYDAYKASAGPILARHGGRFLVRAGKLESLEGGWRPTRFFVVEFDSYDKAREFYFSDDYQAAVKQRQASSNSKAFLVDGV